MFVAPTRKGETLPKLADLLKNELFVVLEEGSLRADEIKLWLTPNTNQSLVIVCTQATRKENLSQPFLSVRNKG